MVERKQFKTETWIIVVKLQKEITMVEVPNPVLGNMGIPMLVPKEKIVGKSKGERIQITEPTLIIPDGDSLEKIEVIPITKRTIIHTQNFRRELNPQ